MVLLTLLAAVTVASSAKRNLFGVVVLAGIYSFLMATVLIVLDAVDVAMTEAAVGAGISPCSCSPPCISPRRWSTRAAPGLLPLFVAIGRRSLSGATYSLPPFGTPDGVIHKHVVPRYSEDSVKETMVPNVVTSVLADYRGYDTLGETTVIFTAGIGVLLLLQGHAAARGEPRSRSGHEARPHPAHRRQDAPAVHPAVRPVRAVPRRARTGRRISGRRHHAPAWSFCTRSCSGLTPPSAIAPPRMVELMVPLGVLIYAGTGVAGLLLGQELSRLLGARLDSPHGHEIGIFLVEAGVLITVAGTMIAIFYASRSGGADDAADDLHRALQLFHHDLSDGRRALHRHRPRQHDQETGRALASSRPRSICSTSQPGKIIGGTAPILDPAFTVYSNPLPHVLILTAIVVGVATLALGLALVVRINEAYGTIEEDEIFAREAQER